MKTIFYTFIFLTQSIFAKAQYFHQDFESSSLLSDYITNSPALGQFNNIGTTGAGMQISLANGGLKYTRTANTGSWSRTTDLSPMPQLLILQFDIEVAGQNAAQTSAASFQIGSGFGTNNSAEAVSLVHSRLAINFSSAAGSFSIRNLSSSINSATYAGRQRVWWVINNSGSSQTYTGPQGISETIADDKADIWIGNMLELDEVAATTGSQPLTDLKFIYSAGAGSVTLDNILATTATPSITAGTATSVTQTSATANWINTSGVAGYELELATDPLFLNPISGYAPLILTGQTSTSQPLTGLAPATDYYFRVRAYQQYGVNKVPGPFTAPEHFMTAAVPAGSITLSATNLVAPDFAQGGSAPVRTYQVSAVSLGSNLTITTDGKSELARNASGPFSNSLQLIPTNGTIASTAIYIRSTGNNLGTQQSVVMHQASNTPDQSLTLYSKMLSPQPAAQGSLQVTGNNTHGIALRVNAGDGNGRVVVVSEYELEQVELNDGVPVTGNPIFGRYNYIDAGTCVVMYGNSGNVEVSGLRGSQRYYIYIIEYNDQGVSSSVNYLHQLNPLIVETVPATGAWPVDKVNTAQLITFDEHIEGVNYNRYAGTGSSPHAPDGGLCSGAWSITGWSYGDVPFNGQFNQGPVAAGAGTADFKPAGIFAYNTGNGNVALGIQGTRQEFDPGEITLKLVNSTGIAVKKLEWKYRFLNFNDANGEVALKCFYSLDGINYTMLPSLEAVSGNQGESNPMITSTSLAAAFDLDWLPGQELYLKWKVLGSTGPWDEIGIDDISITANPIDPIVLPLKVSRANAYSIDAQTIRISAEVDDWMDGDTLCLEYSRDGSRFERLATYSAEEISQSVVKIHGNRVAGYHYYRFTDAGHPVKVLTPVMSVRLTGNPIFSIYPNPASAQFWVTYTGPDHDRMEISLINSAGQTVLTRYSATSRGIRLNVGLTELPAGIYTVICKAGEYSQSKLLMIQ